ncbi:cell division site-positioning protein MapZ family protein [Streptococcus mutans]|uniref:cell division site-positioning protein MapZ family protein n=1 Tax=Streptococcus mutans TaxID=1309 RepID=UPI0002E81154|nr:cell division site-positioning protein MapZ family protein [Streptococcus mutans]MCB4931624.1 cell division site-positioning protein MapZ family protein [Streptococcus mutans]MCB5110101.1 cell division site-positioning protein MapZ family protein [Streptococcus mutans]MDW8509119.1 cell division site-positioning protein MapZ family protein [Streptococcus mutans]
MSEKEKNPVENSESKDSLDFQDAKEMTVGEAVRKDSEIKAGVTEEDSVLDRYIKQHRDEVTARKFDTSSDDFESIDTSTLDNFIKQQRQELVDTGLIDPIEKPEEEIPSESAISADTAKEQSLEDTIVAPAINPNQEIWKKDEFDDVPLSDTQETAKLDTEEKSSFLTAPTSDLDKDDVGNSEDFDEDDETKPPFYKHKKVIMASFIVLLLLAAGATYSVYQLGHHTAKTKRTTKSTSTKKSTDFTAASKGFEKSYTAFFADAKRTKLKNNQFANLPKLEKHLKKLKDSKYYDEAKKKYESLKRQISAINAVNGKFKTTAILNGDKKAAAVKDNANFDDISEKSLNTGNATLDALLKSVIADGRKQLEANNKKSGSSAASSNANSGTSSNTEGSNQNAQAPAADSNTPANGSSGSNNTSGNTSPSTPAAPNNGTSNAGASGYGISSYDVSKLQRDRSRVPYDQSKIADSNNSAWAFNAGILEKIVAISQQRGYITGNDYILEKVNIINGNGYYNMFKPDGTYLFSINCKTGYFVGNAAGHSDKLDY